MDGSGRCTQMETIMRESGQLESKKGSVALNG